jgi:hypothetical protein
MSMSINVRRVEAVILNGVELRAGDRVKIRLNESERGLFGQIAVIDSFELSKESRTQVIVRLEERSWIFQPPVLKLLLTLDEIEAA